MPAAVRYRWMFRTVAVLFLAFGAIWIWRYGFTDYRPEQRPYWLAAGAATSVVGFFLLRLRRFAIGASAVAAAFVGLSATVFATSVRGPGILVLALLALGCMVYTVLAVRALTDRSERSTRP
jgi:hypothetical protein